MRLPLSQPSAAVAAAADASATMLKQLQEADGSKLLEGLLRTSASAAADSQPLLVRALGEESPKARHPALSRPPRPPRADRLRTQAREAAAAKGLALVAGCGAQSGAELLPVLLAYLELDTCRNLTSSRSASSGTLLAVAAGAQSGEARVETRQARPAASPALGVKR